MFKCFLMKSHEEGTAALLNICRGAKSAALTRAMGFYGRNKKEFLKETGHTHRFQEGFPRQVSRRNFLHLASHGRDWCKIVLSPPPPQCLLIYA
ncbi:hypothetical protein HUJ04_008614 [Dendroctonus ponderosae]|nr:hypothetical protein HUJ04_008614 [Dendroctonus ponderosae]